jgi:SAM-dependent methyltransferase
MNNSGTSETLYSVDNAVRFQWSSVSGELNKDRVRFLREFVIGPKVLDAGCGGGGYVDFFSAEGFDAYGLDKFDCFLATAKECQRRGTFIQSDLTARLPFEDKTFDTTCCMDVLEHVDDRTVIKELARVTRRRLILMVPQKDEWVWRTGLVYFTYQDPTHLRYYTPTSIRELVNLITPHCLHIFEQQPIDLKGLVQRTFYPKSRWPGLGRIYRYLFGFLLRRCQVSNLYINLAAVIDLEPNMPT